MTDDPKTSTGTLAESTYDSHSGRIRQESDGKTEALATSPTVAVEETPKERSDRARTKAAARGQGS